MEPQPVLTEKRVWRRIRRFISWTCGLTFLVLLFLGGSVYFFRDKIKTAIIGELNRNLQAEVQIRPENIRVTLFSTFPRCALELNDVLMLEALQKKNRDTLLFARQLRLHFSVLDLWQGRYEIRKISVADALMLPEVDKSGKPNYVFWKQGSRQSQDSTRFMLNDVLLERCRFVYRSEGEKLLVSVSVRELQLSGDFGSSSYRVVSRSDIMIDSVGQGDYSYLRQTRARIGLEMAAEGTAYSITKATARINDLEFVLSGHLRLDDNRLSELAIVYHAPDLNIGSALSLLPARLRTATTDYESSGIIYLDGEVKFRKGVWRTKGSFGAKDAMVVYKPENTRAEAVNFEGSFETGGLQRLEIRGLRANVGGGSITGDFRLTDFHEPRIICDVKASGDLFQLGQFFPVDTIEKIGGRYRLELGVAGRLAGLQQGDLSEETTLRLQCDVTDLAVQFRHDTKGFAVKKCALSANNSQVKVHDLQLRRGSSDLVINGVLPGFFEFLKDGKSKPLIIEGRLKASSVDVVDFLPAARTGEESSNKEPILPGNLRLEMEADIGRLVFGKFNAEKVKGLIEIRDRKLMVSDLRLATMQGSATINALADNSGGKLQVSVESRLERINISQLFAQMNNFGQTTLQDTHIRGFATADINFSGSWSNALESDLNSVRAQCDLTIDRGGLVGFRPLECLGKFVEVKDLENVQFSTLSSKIEISSKKITIPRTTIKNSALDIEYWGTHTFDHTIDYHFQLLMTDLFAARNKSFTNTEFGEVARDSENRRSVFVLMTGNLDDPKIRYDKKGLKQKIKSDIVAEKQNMKALFKEEFGLFRNDETVKPEAAEKPVFRLETQAAQPDKKKELVLKKKDEEDF